MFLRFFSNLSRFFDSSSRFLVRGPTFLLESSSISCATCIPSKSFLLRAAFRLALAFSSILCANFRSSYSSSSFFYDRSASSRDSLNIFSASLLFPFLFPLPHVLAVQKAPSFPFILQPFLCFSSSLLPIIKPFWSNNYIMSATLGSCILFYPTKANYCLIQKLSSVSSNSVFVVRQRTVYCTVTMMQRKNTFD